MKAVDKTDANVSSINLIVVEDDPTFGDDNPKGNTDPKDMVKDENPMDNADPKDLFGE